MEESATPLEEVNTPGEGEAATSEASADGGSFQSPDLGLEVAEFTTAIDSLLVSLGRVMFGLQASEREAATRFSNYAKQYGETTQEDDAGFSVTFHPPYDVRAARLNKSITKAETAVQLVPRVYLLALVSQFDAFLGRLLRAIFILRPELIANSERRLTLAQILDAGSVEAATNLILDKELESVLRKSRSEQFDWMENKFGVTLRKGLDSWCTLIEATERRNLFAHTNGVVSDQYLTVCMNNGVEVAPDCTRGSELEVTPDYYRDAWACHYEIGVKLSQVLWRKLLPDRTEEADSNLVNLTLDLIVDEKLDLARALLDFAVLPVMKPASAETRLIHTLNRGQAYKWSGDQAKCVEIVGAQDWSGTEAKYRLGAAILLDRFNEAAGWMKAVGDGGFITKTDYQEWPIFQEFRKSDEFLKAYEEVFAEPFVHIEKLLAADEDRRRKEQLDHLREFIDREAAGDTDQPATQDVGGHVEQAHPAERREVD